MIYAPHLGHPHSEDLNAEYLNILETRTGTPFFQDVYVDGVRVMLILGPTGTGKSVHGNAMVALEQKYDGFTYIFDIGGSYESVVELYGGRVDRVGKDGPRIDPFSLEPTEANIKFLYSFVKLLLVNGGAELEPEDDDVIHSAVQAMYLFDPENRRLSNLFLPKKLDRYLAKWVFSRAVATSDELRFGQTSAAEKLRGDTVQWEPTVSYPVLCSVTASGPNRRPAARRRSASATPPLRGHGSFQKKFVNARQRTPHKLLPGPSQKALLGTWEPGPLAHFVNVTRAGYGKYNETEITTMYSNKVSDAQHGFRPENNNREATKERIYTPAEHDRHYAPINRELHADDARQFGWVQENGTVQSYQHTGTHRHIHIDGPSSQFYDQRENAITQRTALDRAMGAGNHHAPEPTKVQELAEQQRVDQTMGFGL